MTTTLCNYTAYVGFDDRDILVQHIVDLFAAEGMQRVDRPKGRSLDEPALKCNHWIVAVHQGKPGWIVLSTSPWDLMADQAPDHANSRLFDLCQALQCKGLSVHLADGGPFGQVLYETDGSGHQCYSGWWGELNSTDDVGEYSPQRLRLYPYGQEPPELKFRLLLDLGDLTMGCHCCSGEFESDRIAAHVAHELGEANGRDCWWAWTPDPQKTVLLAFHWPPNDRPDRPLTPHEVFWSQPRHFYADGQPIYKGDAVLIGNGLHPGKIDGLLDRKDSRGLPEPGGVVFKDDACASGTVRIMYRDGPPRADGKYPEIWLVCRDSADPLKDCIAWLENHAAQDEITPLIALGNLYWEGRGVPKSEQRCEELWLRAATLGSAHAKHYLGSIHQMRGDYATALEWQLRAAEQSLPAAIYSVGCFYADGTGVAADSDAAKQWWQRAAELGHPEAKQRLTTLS